MNININIESEPCKILLGALVGIGRAAESSGHLIDRSLDIQVLEGLAALADDAISDESLYEMARIINREKDILVPDCASCSMPCGRNEDYSIDSMANEADEIKRAKLQIIKDTVSKAQELLPRVKAGESLLIFPFYRALYSIGAADWTENELGSVIEEINSL